MLVPVPPFFIRGLFSTLLPLDWKLLEGRQALFICCQHSALRPRKEEGSNQDTNARSYTEEAGPLQTAGMRGIGRRIWPRLVLEGISAYIVPVGS